jgi:hypothetical protein
LHQRVEVASGTFVDEAVVAVLRGLVATSRLRSGQGNLATWKSHVVLLLVYEDLCSQKQLDSQELVVAQTDGCLRLHCEETRDSENFLIVSEVRIPLPTLVGDHLPVNLAVIVSSVVDAPSDARLL